MRLIDAEDYPYKNGAFDLQHGNKHFIRGVETMQEWIDAQPAVDAAPVVHGRWISSGLEVKFINCSVCGKQRFQIDATNYCPYCGARMDGKDEK